MRETPSILFVCLGNICRSPLAEAAFLKLAGEAGLWIEVDSAGTGDWHTGEPPDKRAQATARRHGVDISGARARQVSLEDFSRFTHIVALDRHNLQSLNAIRPDDATAVLSLLLDHVPGARRRDVRDPYYGDASGFEETWRDVMDGSRGLLQAIREKM